MRRTKAAILAAGMALCSANSITVHAETAVAKLGRGLAGVTCGFLELPGNIVEETRENGAVGIPIGFAYGLGMFVTRELVGVYEVLTSPLPVPPGYRPILSPEYPWGYFH